MATKNTISIEKDLKVFTLEEPRQEFKLSETWENGKVLLKVFRRYGCPSCRYEAKMLSNYKKTFEELGVRVIGIGFDEDGLKEWTDGNFWDYELYMDPERKIYNQQALLHHSIIMGFITCLYSREQKSFSKAKELGLGGNATVGDGFQLGATYVIGKGGELEYEFIQDGYGDFPSLKELIKVCGGDSSIVKDEDDEMGRICNQEVCSS